MDYKIAICDDSEADRRYLTELMNRWAMDAGHTVQVSAFVSAESFLFRYEEKRDYDILLLDIEMGAMDGVTLARRIRQGNELVQIVFITGFPEFMAEGYEVSALHYLMKPVAEEKLFPVLDRAAGNIVKAERRLCVSYDRQRDYIPLGQIYYIEAQKQYVAVHTEDKIYRMKASLSDTEKLLDEYFFKCQRSFLVNLRHVKRIMQNHVVLKNDEEIPIGRGMAEKVGKEMIRLF